MCHVYSLREELENNKTKTQHGVLILSESAHEELLHTTKLDVILGNQHDFFLFCKITPPPSKKAQLQFITYPP